MCRRGWRALPLRWNCGRSSTIAKLWLNVDLIQPFIHAALTPSLVGWLGPACDYICNTFIRERTEEQKTTVGKKTVTMRKRTGAVEYCLRTGPSSVYTTKFRIPRGRNLPDVLVDPSYAKIAEIVKG